MPAKRKRDIPCPFCRRRFVSDHGLAIHVGYKHTEDARRDEESGNPRYLKRGVSNPERFDRPRATNRRGTSRYSDETKRIAVGMASEGYKVAAIARRLDVPERTIYDWIRAAEKDTADITHFVTPEPKKYHQLSNRAGFWLGPKERISPEAFVAFCTEALGLDPRPFWVEMCLGFSDPYRPRVLENVMPGVGKTTSVLAYIAWRILLERALGNLSFAVLYGSNTDTLARRGLQQVKDWYSEPALVQEFGRIEPSNREGMWSQRQIILAGMGKGKEATLAAWGVGKKIRGIRPHLNIWDDPQAPEDATPEKTDEFMRWWDSSAESRTEPVPGSKTAVVGSYASPTDVHHALADRRIQHPDGTETKDWHHIKFVAHDEEKCGGTTHGAYPEGCLLWPERWPFESLERIRQNNELVYRLEYQLEDIPAGEVLVPRIWVEGGSEGGHVYTGCLDEYRDMWVLPPNLSDNAVMVASLDPSQTQWSAFQLWVWDDPYDYLIAVDTLRLRGDDTYARQIAEWTAQARELMPFSCWIVEESGNKYLLDSQEIREIWPKIGCTLIAHKTTGNKNDRESGPWGMRDQFRYGRVRIPWAAPGPTREAVKQFVDEHTRYPFSARTDHVMADWFHFYWRHTIPTPNMKPVKMWRPSWMREKMPVGVGR